MQMCGGPSEEKPVTEEIIKICEEIQAELEGKSGKSYTRYTPHKYRSQVVAGTNYFVKIAVETDDGPDYIHVRIFKPLPCNGDKSEVHSFQIGKSEEDPIVYF